MRFLTPAHDSERGGVLVLVAVAIPVLIMLASFVIDVGNWYEHKRHLQLQADAAALAGGGLYKSPCDSGTDSAIAAEARKYAGPAASGGGTYNAQVGNTPAANLHVLINSTDYYNQGGSDNSLGTPCSTGFVDVKATETDAPWYLKVGALVGLANPTINAHARVNLFTLESGGGFLPIALPVPDPRSAAVQFVNESTGTVIASSALTRNGAANGLAIWDNSSAPISLPVNTANIGVRVILSGSSSTTCGDTLVQCYTGVDYVRGFDATAVYSNTTGPAVNDATLTPGTCSDAWFAGSTCTVGFSAAINIGTHATGSAIMKAVVAGTSYPLTYSATTGRWSTAGTPISIPAGAGQRPVTLSWELQDGTWNGNTCTHAGTTTSCKGTISSTLQRSYGAINTATGSGPITTLSVLTGGGASVSNHSYALGSTVSNVVVRIGIQDVLELAAASDPPVQLRVVVGSQNQSVDCDPNVSTLKEELHLGCAPIYGRNSGSDACGTSAPALWGTPQPWLCVATQTGGATNQIPAGLNERILGTDKPSSCTSPNHWPNYQPGDPRVVQLFVTPFGSFDGNGSTTVPVTRFAAFYITGWTGQGSGFNNPCQGNGDDPAPDSATIVGHFIKYVDTTGNGAGSSGCDFTSVDSCALIMTQ